MRRLLLALTLLFAAPAVAQDASDAVADGTAQAEYVRLSHEMQRLAQKGHWEGVERAYLGARATGVDLSFLDHMSGVQAALARGDVASGRTRLLAARVLRDDDPEVIESLWSIDTAFARVALKADPGATLSIAAMPFDPQQSRAITYAQAAVQESGAFVGLLPEGVYTLAGTSFVIEVHEIGAEPTTLDTRTQKAKKRRK